MNIGISTRLMTGVAFCVLAVGHSVGAQHPSDSRSVALGLTHGQPDAPVALRGYLASAGTFLYDKATVENISAKPISGVSFGVLVADPNSRKAPELLRSSMVEVSLLPGNRQDVDVHLLPAAQLEDLKRSFSSTPKVTLGVREVEWADGTRWVFFLPDAATDFLTGKGRIVPMDQPR
jgi:hypothetical protein